MRLFKSKSKSANKLVSSPVRLDKDSWFVKKVARPCSSGGQVDIKLRQAYILPTLKGLYYIMTLVIMFIWSTNYGLSLGFILLFLALMFFLVFAVLTVRNISSLRFTAVAAVPVFLNDNPAFNLRVEKREQLDKVLLYAVRNQQKSNTISLIEDNDAVFKIPDNLLSRGLHQLGYVKIETHYPLGLFRSWFWLNVMESLLVYPNPKGNLPIPLVLKSQGHKDKTQINFGSEDFFGLREYQFGDSTKHIVWRKSQGNQVMAKQFADNAGESCELDFNLPQLQQLDLEDKISQLSLWVLNAEKQGLNYKLVLPNHSSAYGRGNQHMHQCLKVLACY